MRPICPIHQVYWKQIVMVVIVLLICLALQLQKNKTIKL